MTEQRRIQPPARFEKFLEQLTEQGLFERKQAAITFAAAVGYHLGKRGDVGKAGEGIRWQVFESNADETFINAVALAECGSVSVLGSERKEEEDPVTIFEKFAASGLEHLHERLAQPGDPLDQILSVITEARSKTIEVRPGLEGLTAADIELLGGTN